MDSSQFAFYRKRLGLTQKELSQLLVTSIKTVHSYEQGWRNIPENIERQIYFLLSREKSIDETPQCWLIKRCPPDRKEKCPAWKFNAGHLCWFINGTICEGLAQKTWKEKIKVCKECEVFKPVLNQRSIRSDHKTVRKG
ncbi:MAG TPA: helix-turn-helix transcriptional regulator [Thermodesulfobacteriota bacterium]|nr:helix-turn-helix transcriptional regulator [Thermodesulfobacteriota bacterium]